jgi:exosome complex exonuclease RRP6
MAGPRCARGGREYRVSKFVFLVELGLIFCRYVRSNRFLFKLVDQPPPDIAALMHAFPSTPPVVRRRAEELLDVIRGAVRKGLSVPAAPVVPSEEAMPEFKEEVECAALALRRHRGCGLIANLLRVRPPRFSVPRLPCPPPALYSTSQRSLFGVSPEPKTKSSGRFQDVVNRIHSTLVVAPTVPQVTGFAHILFTT